VDRDKAIVLAGKLARVAAPNSGATEAERTNAALELAKIIAEHGLAIMQAPVVEKRRRRSRAEPQYRPPPPPAWSYPVSHANWTEALLETVSRCVICRRTLFPQDRVWYEPSHGYRCFDIECIQ
jgi:hypothetical protein